MLPAVLTDEDTARILCLAVTPSQAHSVALPERACEGAPAPTRHVASLLASELSVAQFKTVVVAGKGNNCLLAYKSAFLKGLPIL